MKRILFLTFVISFVVNAQPSIEWQKSLGGTSNDLAFSIKQTTDGGYIVAGSTSSINGDISGNNGNDDYWIVKLDNNGNISWQKSLGGTSDDRAYSIEQTTDGGYIVAGYSYSNDNDVSDHHGTTNTCDYWIVRLDSVGNIVWQKSLGGTRNDLGRQILQTTDGGYIVAGESFSNDGDVSGHHGTIGFCDYWIVKLDSIGNIIWQKSFGGTDDDLAKSIQQTTDGGYIIGGHTASSNGDISVNNITTDYWIVKLDNNGNILWEKNIGDEYFPEYANSIQQTTDNGYIVAGFSGSLINDFFSYDYWIVKLDNNGNILWEKTLGGTNEDYAHSILQTPEGGYIVAGYSYSSDGDVSNHYGTTSYSDYWIVKLDSNGNILWQKSLGGTYDERAYSIEQTTDGGYIIAGLSYSNDGDVAGHYGTTNTADYWIVKLSQDLSVADLEKSKIIFYPNPVKNTLYFSEPLKKVEVYTVDSKRVLNENDKDNINLNDLPVGLYILKGETIDDKKVNSKFVKN